jgi:hypothetical protein
MPEGRKALENALAEMCSARTCDEKVAMEHMPRENA